MKWKGIDLAKKLGVDRAAISQAAKRGTLFKNPKGLYDDTNEINIRYISCRNPQFYIPEDANPNARPGKQNGFKAGSGQNTSKKPKKARVKKETVIYDDGTEFNYDPSDIDEVKTVEQIKKLRIEQERIELNNQKARGDLIETSVVSQIFSSYIPEYKKRVLVEVEQHIRNICSEQGVESVESVEYLRTLTEIMGDAANQANLNIRKDLEKVLGENASNLEES